MMVRFKLKTKGKKQNRIEIENLERITFFGFYFRNLSASEESLFPV